MGLYCECPVECASLAFKTTTIIITIYPGVIFCCHLDIYPQVTHSKSSYFSYTATISFADVLICTIITWHFNMLPQQQQDNNNSDNENERKKKKLTR
ncbi:hypothetical protein DERF_009391 [Dermatophagoides farinae]|uniref:Uncharacterized protein n=1 Tax=Dermatophagoides farinae TaxID=6954 RepID=A0A922L0T9_DERFA|nr:hypothetical protein DERF_009391 [Dermatophagoides farinae]